MSRPTDPPRPRIQADVCSEAPVSSLDFTIDQLPHLWFQHRGTLVDLNDKQLDFVRRGEITLRFSPTGSCGPLSGTRTDPDGTPVRLLQDSDSGAVWTTIEGQLEDLFQLDITARTGSTTQPAASMRFKLVDSCDQGSGDLS